MGVSTFSPNYIQVVFAVKSINSLICPNWEEKLYKYITGIIQNNDKRMLAINGMPYHNHFLMGTKPSCCLSNLVQEVKKSANAFIKEKNISKFKFDWQEGYAAFSYSHSALDAVIAYIRNKKGHHKNKSFKEEYKDFLIKI